MDAIETTAAPAAAGHGVARLSAQEVRTLVDAYFKDLDVRPWNRFSSIDWARLEPNRLNDDVRSAVSFVTLIEDHLPGYFLDYMRVFPVDENTPLEDYVHNRELYRFAVKWAQEEDAHAHVLSTYQVRAGFADAESLRRDLAIEARKPFHLPSTPIQTFTYTLIQEKATQLFYQQLAQVVTEPVLKEILQHLVRDEARHFAFWARLVKAYLERFGEALLPAVKDTMQSFTMPLSQTLPGYWRWSLRISDAVGGYEHTEAYEDLVRTVRSCAEASRWSKVHDLEAFVQAIRRLS